MSYVLADIGGFEVIIAVIGAVVATAIMTAIKAVKWWTERDQTVERVRQITGERSRDSSQVAHWSEISGPQRPVTLSECKDNHSKPCPYYDGITEDIQVHGKALDVQARQMDEIKTALLELKGDIREGFAKMPGKISVAVRDQLDRHEKIFHRTKSGSFGGPKGSDG